MPEYTTIGGAKADLYEHPAVKAWMKLRLAPLEPLKIVILKPELKRSAVYRVESARPVGSSVIAKRARLANISLEFKVYREILSYLPLRSLRCFGFAEDSHPEFGWLFLEDAGEERYSSSDEKHRSAAAQWLALLHASAASHVETRAWLPDRGLEYYRHIVGLVRTAIEPNLANPALSVNDRTVLHAILDHCDVLESRWSEIADICCLMPHTLVHGDFSAKNVRILRGHTGLDICPLDWDAAGWGIAAPDLSLMDAAVYCSVARHYWPCLNLHALKRLANVGRIFWALEPITGEAEPLASNWLGNVMRKMRSYEAEILDALKAAGWAYAQN